MLSIGPVEQHHKGGSGAPSFEALLPYLKLVGWALKETTYAWVSSFC